MSAMCETSRLSCSSEPLSSPAVAFESLLPAVAFESPLPHPALPALLCVCVFVCTTHARTHARTHRVTSEALYQPCSVRRRRPSFPTLASSQNSRTWHVCARIKCFRGWATGGHRCPACSGARSLTHWGAFCARYVTRFSVYGLRFAVYCLGFQGKESERRNNADSLATITCYRRCRFRRHAP